MASNAQCIDGPAGPLEIDWLEPASPSGEGVAVICHPHPQHGGSMHNKVVHILCKACNELGLPALRFNFRDVGASAGEFDDGVGERDDMRAACDHARRQHPGVPLWLAGFSFGARVALEGWREAQADYLISVAPPVSLYDMRGIDGITIPWLLVQGGKDEIVDPEAVREWAASRRPAPAVRWLDEAGHFFHGQLNALRQAVVEWGAAQ